MKHSHLIKSIFASSILLISSSPVFASDISNWTETFQLPAKNWIKHTPSSVSLSGIMTVGKELSFLPNTTIFHMTISACGLNVKTESTREEFVTALKCAGIYDGN